MPTTLILIATEVDSVGRPTAQRQQGARLIWTDDLREPGPNQPIIGQHAGDCVLVREASSPQGEGIWFCRAGWTLPNGNLVAGGLVDFSGAGGPARVAIFGGTAAYKDARGEIRVTANPAPNQTEYRLEILP
jgi:Allene oxide cyclase barrel like domain